MNSLACINDCKTKKEEVPAEFTPEIRIDKVLSVRRQLGEGRYYARSKIFALRFFSHFDMTDVWQRKILR